MTLFYNKTPWGRP